MSMTLSAQPSPAADQWFSHLLARVARNRRTSLGLTVEQAAELSGMAVSEWMAMEEGWVPENRAVLQSVAATLGIFWAEMETISSLARCAQQTA